MDEPAWALGPVWNQGGQEYMPAAYKLLKEHDPNHPVTAVLCHFTDPQLFAPYMDVIQADYYPIPPIPANWYAGTGFQGINMFVNNTRRATQNQKPFWFVAQAFNWGKKKAENESWEVPAEWRRFPTQRELRTMTYTAIAAGARGVFYYSLMDLIIDNRQTGGYLSRVEHWEWLKQVVGELNQLIPVLTADTPEVIRFRDRVVTMVKSDGQDIYIIAANYERQPTQTRISVPGIRQASAELMFEPGDPVVSIENGGFTATFEPVESHIWRITPGQIRQRFPER